MGREADFAEYARARWSVLIRCLVNTRHDSAVRDLRGMLSLD